MFTNNLGNLGSIPGWVIPKIQEMVHDSSLLNTQHYKCGSRISEPIQEKEECPYLLANEKGANDYSRPTYMYIWKRDLVLNNLQGLICHKSWTNQPIIISLQNCQRKTEKKTLLCMHLPNPNHHHGQNVTPIPFLTTITGYTEGTFSITTIFFFFRSYIL